MVGPPNHRRPLRNSIPDLLTDVPDGAKGATCAYLQGNQTRDSYNTSTRGYEHEKLLIARQDHWAASEDINLVKGLVHSEEALSKAGYIFQSISGKGLESKKRCRLCHKVLMSKSARKASGRNSEDNETRTKQEASTNPLRVNPTPQNDPPPPQMKCKFHNGTVQQAGSIRRLGQSVEEKWTCCNRPLRAPGCREALEHTPFPHHGNSLAQNWKFHETPPMSWNAGAKHIRKAVAIDCEMGVSETGDSELVRVSLVDYFTSEVLVDKLVYPAVKMLHLNTRWSGVSWSQMDKAIQGGRCLYGRDSAREAVWKFVGQDTVVIGHACHNDLIALRWIHRHVVDTLLLKQFQPPKVEDAKLNPEAPAFNWDGTGIAPAQMSNGLQLASGTPKGLIGQTQPDPSPNSQNRKPKKLKGAGPLALKSLTKEKLGRDIQLPNKPHDSVEDAVAARDLVRWVLDNEDLMDLA